MKKFDKFHEAEFFEGVTDWYLQHENVRLHNTWAMSPNDDRHHLMEIAKSAKKRTYEAAIVVGEKMGISLDSLFARVAGSRNEVLLSDRPLWTQYTERLSTELDDFLPKDIISISFKFRRTNLIFLHDTWGHKVGAVCIYTDQDGHQAIVPASLREIGFNPKWNGTSWCSERLVLGHMSTNIRFLNEHLIEQHRTACVVFPLDFIAAMALNAISSPSNTSVISGCWCDETIWNICDWGVFDNRDVLIIPHATRDSFLMVDSVVEWIKDRARKINICLSPTTDPDVQLDENSPDPFERHLATNAVSIATAQSITSLNDSPKLSPEEFTRWSKNVGLIVDEGNAEFNLEADASFDQDALLRHLHTRSAIPALDELIVPKYITGIIGDSDAGKGLLAYSFSVGLGCGFDILGLSIHHVKKVLYFDAETSSVGADIKIERIRSAYHARSDLRDKNVKRISLLGENPNLMEETWQTKLEKHLDDHRPNVVVFDNLFSMANGVWQSSTRANKMFTWFRYLAEKYSVAVVYCHHTGKNGKTFGTEFLEASTQNVIHITGRDRLVDRNPSLKQEYEDKPGCLCEIHFKKIKEFASLLGKTRIMYLDYHEENPISGNQWVEVGSKDVSSPTNRSDVNNEALRLYRERLVDDGAEVPASMVRNPKEKERSILWFAAVKFVRDGTGWFTRNDIDHLFKSSDEDKRNVLKRMVEKGWLDCSSHGKTHRYKWHI